ELVDQDVVAALERCRHAVRAHSHGLDDEDAQERDDQYDANADGPARNNMTPIRRVVKTSCACLRGLVDVAASRMAQARTPRPNNPQTVAPTASKPLRTHRRQLAGSIAHNTITTISSEMVAVRSSTPTDSGTPTAWAP